MTDVNTGTMSAPAKRPTLLTVLCIISFVWGAWQIISNTRTYLSAGDASSEMQAEMDEAQAQLDEAMEQMGGTDNPMAGALEGVQEMAASAMAAAKPMALTDIIITIIALIGVWMMWKLRKTGFWIYLLATIAGFASMFYFLGFNIATIIGGIVVLIFSLLFVILYAVNLKHMH